MHRDQVSLLSLMKKKDSNIADSIAACQNELKLQNATYKSINEWITLKQKTKHTKKLILNKMQQILTV